MQSQSPLARFIYGDLDQNSSETISWGNGGLAFPGLVFPGMEGGYFLSAPSDSRVSSGSTGGTSSASTGGTGGSSSSGTTTGNSSVSPFVINVTWDSSVSSAPAGFTSAVMKAVQYLEGQFCNPVTINIAVGYGECGSNALDSGAIGQNRTYLNQVAYSSLVSALESHATTAADQNAVAALPASNPTGGTFWATTAEQKALGLRSGTNTALDGYVGFSSGCSFTYDNSGGVAAGTYDFYGTAVHEITEVMGRMLRDGATTGGTSGYFPLDLFHFSSAGVPDFSFSTPGYLSANGGTTDSGDLNTVAGGDPGDWASGMGNDAFDAFANSGVVNAISGDGLLAMNLAGWQPTGSVAPPPPPPPPSGPTGVAFSPVSSSVAACQGAAGLAATGTITGVNETGGTSGDSFTYTLGGSGAGSFTLATSNNAATLATGAAGAAGAVNGAVYALTVTATDSTNGLSSPAGALDVVVGSGGGDTINLATLVGAGSTATPTFVFGLAGNDTINGAGMTSNLWIAGGAGADVMTGGSGVNDYLYGAASDSTPSAPDIITNFHASDLIDLTGLGGSLSCAGSLPTSITSGHGKNAATTNQVLPGHSFGWQANGGNTFVYANTGSTAVAIGAASLEIELHGNIALSSGNFLHH